MSPPPSVKVTVRLSPNVIARLDALIETVAEKTGLAASRSDVLREALMSGIRTLERQRSDT